MLMFFTSVGLLVVGYFLYGRLVDRLFGADPARKTPAETLEDGVDYVKLPPWKIFLIQLLNIAGLGPIYGAILGARVPIILTSRADSAEARLASCAVAVAFAYRLRGSQPIKHA